jgi:histidine decarboxylase
MAMNSEPAAKRQKFVDFVSCIERSERLAAAGPRGMGYPMNFHRIDELAELRVINTRNFISNNCGDPFQSGERGWASNTFDTEAGLLKQLMAPWGGSEENCWGYLTTGGTEGVTKGISAGLHRLGLTKKRVMLVHCSQAHYSISKAAHMLMGETSGNKGLIATIPPNVKGEMRVDKLREVVASASALGVDAFLCVCTIGTTFMGANDDVAAARGVFADYGYVGDKLYMHLDAALNGGWWNLDPETPKYKLGVHFDSLSISGHKWYGGFIGGSVYILKGDGLAEGSSQIKYVKMIDKMISGSRPGDTAVLWQARLYQFDWVEEFARCKTNCKFLVQKLAELGVSTSFQSLNVVMPKPSEDLTRKYQLMPYDDNCQCIVLPHVTQEQLAVFAEEYSAELRAGKVQKTTTLLKELSEVAPSAEHR